MSATKLDTSGVFSNPSADGSETLLNLPKNTFRVRKNGIDFQTGKPIPDWTEMTVALQSPDDGKNIQCTGVVVGCHGSQSAGYSVSMVFMNLTPQSEATLAQLAVG